MSGKSLTSDVDLFRKLLQAPNSTSDLYKSLISASKSNQNAHLSNKKENITNETKQLTPVGNNHALKEASKQTISFSNDRIPNTRLTKAVAHSFENSNRQIELPHSPTKLNIGIDQQTCSPKKRQLLLNKRLSQAKHVNPANANKSNFQYNNSHPKASINSPSKQKLGKAKATSGDGNSSIDNILNSALKEFEEIQAYYDGEQHHQVSKNQVVLPSTPLVEETPVQVENTSSIQELQEKLNLAETVLKKLYQRNLFLEKNCNQIAEESAPVENGLSLDKMVELHTQSEAHLRLLLSEKDNRIQELNEQIKKLNTKSRKSKATDIVEVSSSMYMSRIHVLEGQLAASRNELNKMRLFNYNFTSKDKSVGKLSNNDVIKTLTEQLKLQTSEYQSDIDNINFKFRILEQQLCDLYVEKSQLEQKLQQAAIALNEEQAVESKIQDCMHGLFEYVKEQEIMKTI